MGEKLPVLCFLQNQWIKPESIVGVRRIYAKHGTTPEGRASVNARILFAGSLTGKRLRAAFGDLSDRIIWEEASREVGTVSRAAFPPDPGHMEAVYKYFKPQIVVTFGKQAETGWRTLNPLGNFPCLCWTCCHPAHRKSDTMTEVRTVANRVRCRLRELGLI